MSELIEIVFENINKSSLTEVIHYFIEPNNNITDIDIFFKDEESVQVMAYDINEELLFRAPKKILMKLKDLKLHNEKQLKYVNAWIYINELSFDVELDFDLKQERNNMPDLISNLFYFSEEFAKLFDVKIFYSGLEPAHDEDTRFFTKNILGPLTLKD